VAPMLAQAVEWSGSKAVESYRILSCFDLLLFGWTVALLVVGRRPATATDSEDPIRAEPTNVKGEVGDSTCQEEVHRPSVLLTCVLIFCTDVCFSSAFFWCFTYGTKALQLAPTVASYLNSALWVIFTVVQFAWAYLQKRYPEQCSPRNILRVIMPLTLLMALGMGFDRLAVIPPVCLVLLGLGGGMNALFTAILRQRSSISGKAFGVIRISSACGNMFGGTLVGWTDDWLGLSEALPSVAAGGIGMALVCFFGFAYRSLPTASHTELEAKPLLTAVECPVLPPKATGSADYQACRAHNAN